ncbi:hypothetical protein [Acidiferrobacter sp.]|uniref:hypothetical protein n=1 Tax=Acidiferrobacter sp. TaxID=1872107 RepID=UPI002613E126|nr:hypothetical protein [Acidiferrobacter sp.]
MQIGVATDEAVANHCVFIIDSCEVNRAALQCMLQDGYETHEWRAVELALERIRSRRPQAVIIGQDAMGPDAAQTVDKIRGASPDTRVLVVIGSPHGSQGPGHLASGAHGLITQPLSIEAVRRTVRLALGLPVMIAIGVAPG